MKATEEEISLNIKNIRNLKLSLIHSFLKKREKRAKSSKTIICTWVGVIDDDDNNNNNNSNKSKNRKEFMNCGRVNWTIGTICMEFSAFLQITIVNIFTLYTLNQYRLDSGFYAWIQRKLLTWSVKLFRNYCVKARSNRDRGRERETDIDLDMLTKHICT